MTPYLVDETAVIAISAFFLLGVAALLGLTIGAIAWWIWR